MADCSSIFSGFCRSDFHSRLAKIGISDVESNLGTAIRTDVVLIMVWRIVLGRNEQKEISRIDRKELLFIMLSGIATGAALMEGKVSKKNAKADELTARAEDMTK